MTLKERLRNRIPEEDNELVLDDLLETAKEVILSNLYPFEEEITGKEIPTKYKSLCLNIATEMYSKRGAEGEVAHSENGVSRTYSSAYVSDALLRQITPRGTVIGSVGDDDDA